MKKKKRGPGSPHGGKNKLKKYSIAKREDYQSFWGAQDKMRDTWRPFRSVQQKRWEPTVEELFRGKKPGDDDAN